MGDGATRSVGEFCARWRRASTLLCGLLAFGGAPTLSAAAPPATGTASRVIGYYPAWGIYDRSFEIADLPGETLREARSFVCAHEPSQLRLLEPQPTHDRSVRARDGHYFHVVGCQGLERLGHGGRDKNLDRHLRRCRAQCAGQRPNERDASAYPRRHSIDRDIQIAQNPRAASYFTRCGVVPMNRRRSGPASGTTIRVS